MLFKAQEDRPTPPEVYNWRIYAMAVLIAWGSILFGYDGAFLGTTITQRSFQRDFGLATESASARSNTSANITSAFQAAAFFGCLPAWFISDKLGRKFTIRYSLFIFIIGAIIQTVATHQLSMIIAGRVLTGWGVGALTAVIPFYIAELSPPAIRGQLTGLFEISYQIGSVIGFWINYGITRNLDTSKSIAWRIPVAVQLIPSGILCFGTFYLRETPHWLLKKGKTDKALEILSFLRMLPSDHVYIQEEISLIEAQLQHERSVAKDNRDTFGAFFMGALRESFLPGIRNRMGLVFIMFMFQNFSGANAINYYSPTLFKSIGITNTTLYTGIYGAIKAVGSIIFYVAFIDKMGRRPPWIVSCVCCALCTFYLAGYVKIGHPAGETVLSASTRAGGHAATAMIMLYAFFWSFGANGLPWVISAELFPANIRSYTGCYTAMCQWLWQFVITRTTEDIFNAMGWGTWLFFGVCLITAAIWAVFFLPETKGLRIEEADKLFGFVSGDYAAQIEAQHEHLSDLQGDAQSETKSEKLSKMEV